MGATQATSIFRITGGREESFSEQENGQHLTTGKFFMSYEGELEGTSVLMELKNYLSATKATVYGLERVTGILDDKAGSFVFEHIGIFDNGVLSSKRVIVNGSGTGALKGLRGEAFFTSGEEKEFKLALDYYFE